MKTCLIFLFLPLLIASGVFGDEVKSVSVMEGHSVTLHTDVIKHKDDVIMWNYGPEHTFVARINGKADSTLYSDDERFRDRVKLNHQTGDLIITHITSQHSGLYQLKISSNNNKVYKRFNLTVSGVFTGDVKSVSVREGHSVILHTEIVKQRDDLMVWIYGPENTCVAITNGKANSIMLSEDEMFRARVKLDDQTGDLMIHDTTTHHSGLYTLKISSNNAVSVKRYNLTVSGEVKSVSVREGHSVTLHTHVLKKRDDLMVWTYGPENTLVARIDGKANSIIFSDDERFIERVKLDGQTGALMITDIKTHHSGRYTISINKVSYKTFEVTIHDSRVPMLWVIPVVGLLLLIGVCILTMR